MTLGPCARRCCWRAARTRASRSACASCTWWSAGSPARRRPASSGSTSSWSTASATSPGTRRASGSCTWRPATACRTGSPPAGGPSRRGGGHRLPIAIAAGERSEPLGEAGALVRRWEALEGTVETEIEPLGGGLMRIAVEIANTTPWPGGDREEALRRTFCSTHTVLRAAGGEFVSPTDPPERLREAAAACHNEGAWPVLVGERGERHTLLSSAIILEDHPRVAPESPGDLFDGGEIDQMLVLNILTLTDEERADMRDADPRTREILERTEALTEEELMRLHGAIREFGMARGR